MGKRSRLREKEGWSTELVQEASVSRVRSEEGVVWLGGIFSWSDE